MHLPSDFPRGSLMNSQGHQNRTVTQTLCSAYVLSRFFTEKWQITFSLQLSLCLSLSFSKLSKISFREHTSHAKWKGKKWWTRKSEDGYNEPRAHRTLKGLAMYCVLIGGIVSFYWHSLNCISIVCTFFVHVSHKQE